MSKHTAKAFVAFVVLGLVFGLILVPGAGLLVMITGTVIVLAGRFSNRSAHFRTAVSP